MNKDHINFFFVLCPISINKENKLNTISTKKNAKIHAVINSNTKSNPRTPKRRTFIKYPFVCKENPTKVRIFCR